LGYITGKIAGIPVASSSEHDMDFSPKNSEEL